MPAAHCVEEEEHWGVLHEADPIQAANQDMELEGAALLLTVCGRSSLKLYYFIIRIFV